MSFSGCLRSKKGAKNPARRMTGSAGNEWIGKGAGRERRGVRSPWMEDGQGKEAECAGGGGGFLRDF